MTSATQNYLEGFETLTREQLLELLDNSDKPFTINVKVRGTAGQWFESSYQSFCNTVRRYPYTFEQVRSYEVLIFPVSGELYIFEVN